VGLPERADSYADTIVTVPEPPVAPSAPAVSLSVQVRKEQIDERLVALFQNRAELKKEFAELRSERDRLLEMLADQRANTEREQQRLRALEQCLSDPETGIPALVYYQLRSLWSACYDQLELFKGELLKQQEERERKRVQQEFNRQREQRLQAHAARLQSVRADSETKKVAVASVEARQAALRGFWNFFKRRALNDELNAKRLEHEAVREHIERLLDERVAIESEPCPEPRGLGVEGKRLVNLALLALAQHLYLHFSENSLASLARGAMLKSLREQHYGMRADCEQYMDQIVGAVAKMRSERGHGHELKLRANGLRARVRYKNDTDTTPAADSMDGIPIQASETDFGGLVQVNVLTDNYWNVLDLLMR
jgi:hypothetical protein